MNQRYQLVRKKYLFVWLIVFLFYTVTIYGSKEKNVDKITNENTNFDAEEIRGDEEVENFITSWVENQLDKITDDDNSLHEITEDYNTVPIAKVTEKDIVENYIALYRYYRWERLIITKVLPPKTRNEHIFKVLWSYLAFDTDLYSLLNYKKEDGSFSIRENFFTHDYYFGQTIQKFPRSVNDNNTEKFFYNFILNGKRYPYMRFSSKRTIFINYSSYTESDINQANRCFYFDADTREDHTVSRYKKFNVKNVESLCTRLSMIKDKLCFQNCIFALSDLNLEFCTTLKTLEFDDVQFYKPGTTNFNLTLPVTLESITLKYLGYNLEKSFPNLSFRNLENLSLQYLKISANDIEKMIDPFHSLSSLHTLEIDCRACTRDRIILNQFSFQTTIHSVIISPMWANNDVILPSNLKKLSIILQTEDIWFTDSDSSGLRLMNVNYVIGNELTQYTPLEELVFDFKKVCKIEYEAKLRFFTKYISSKLFPNLKFIKFNNLTQNILNFLYGHNTSWFKKSGIITLQKYFDSGRLRPITFSSRVKEDTIYEYFPQHWIKILDRMGTIVDKVIKSCFIPDKTNPQKYLPTFITNLELHFSTETDSFVNESDKYLFKYPNVHSLQLFGQYGEINSLHIRLNYPSGSYIEIKIISDTWQNHNKSPWEYLNFKNLASHHILLDQTSFKILFAFFPSFVKKLHTFKSNFLSPLVTDFHVNLQDHWLKTFLEYEGDDQYLGCFCEIDLDFLCTQQSILLHTDWNKIMEILFNTWNNLNRLNSWIPNPIRTVLIGEFDTLKHAVELQFKDSSYTSKPYQNNRHTQNQRINFENDIEIIFESVLNPATKLKIQWTFIMNMEQNNRVIDFSFGNDKIFISQPSKCKGCECSRAKKRLKT